ncbi:hypothetical protein NPIL_684321 [Nephila pilipes]|uniref:Uncharacterized protein n=1 Tax=Nephila pilipes TaxID=299642 RepID=A0A8X6NRF0_NEPPI|nr:hypothetical protein NPIL_684321 [Nephila pilipes]
MMTKNPSLVYRVVEVKFISCSSILFSPLTPSSAVVIRAFSDQKQGGFGDSRFSIGEWTRGDDAAKARHEYMQQL